MKSEGLKFARLMMVLSSLSPLFLLWAVRGFGHLPDRWVWIVCALLVISPNLILWLRVRVAIARNDIKTITVHEADDHREHLLVYLFAMLIPLYDANVGSLRDATATVIAFVFIVFLFWHLNLHYMNVLFAIMGFHVFTIETAGAAIGGQQPFVLLTTRNSIRSDTQIRALRISDSVYLEPRSP